MDVPVTVALKLAGGDRVLRMLSLNAALPARMEATITILVGSVRRRWCKKDALDSLDYERESVLG